MQRCQIEAPEMLVQGKGSKLSYLFRARKASPEDSFSINGASLTVFSGPDTVYKEFSATVVGLNVYFQVDLIEELEENLLLPGLYDCLWSVSTSFGDVILQKIRLRVI